MKELNIYCVDEIIKIGQMFKDQGYELQGLYIKDSEDLKITKKVLNFHASDMVYSEGKTTAFCMVDNDEKIQLLWFQLISYQRDKFTHWKLIKETTEYS
jgi:hypothetical protein